MPSRRIYAIKLGEHVEFRSALKQPRAIVSKFTRTVLETQHDAVPDETATKRYGYPRYKYVAKTVPVERVMKQTFYVGGRVLGFCKHTRFVTRAGLARFGKRSIIEVPVEVKEKCLRS